MCSKWREDTRKGNKHNVRLRILVPRNTASALLLQCLCYPNCTMCYVMALYKEKNADDIICEQQSELSFIHCCFLNSQLNCWSSNDGILSYRKCAWISTFICCKSVRHGNNGRSQPSYGKYWHCPMSQIVEEFARFCMHYLTVWHSHLAQCSLPITMVKIWTH